VRRVAETARRTASTTAAMSRRRRHTTAFASENGQTAVEFALIAPLLVVLLLGIIQVGIAFHHYIEVTDAARAAARKAIVARLAGITTTDVQQAATAAAPDLSSPPLSVSVSDPTDPTFTKAGSTVTVTVSYPYSINLLGWVVSSGTISSTMSDRLE
jgi:Flp pilus assembly protein TadG